MSGKKGGRVAEFDPLMTVQEILEVLGFVSRDTFYKWRQTGKGPRCFTLPNGELRCRASELMRWLKALEEAA